MTPDEREIQRLVDGLNIDARMEPASRTDLRRRMFEAFEKARSQEPPPGFVRLGSWLRRSIMNPKYQRITAAAAVLVALVGTFAWRSTTQAGVTFADLVQTVQKAHSATFTLTISGVGPQPETIKVSVLGNRVRQEHPEGEIEINEPSQGRSLALMLDHKAVLANQSGLPPREVEDFAQNSLFLLRQRLGEAASRAKDAGQKQINGQTAKGFLVQDGKRQLTVWADVASRTILQVDWPLGSDITFTMKDFHFDADLDEALFSFTPPPGYKLFQMNLANASEKDLLYYLRVSAESRGGAFPAQIQEWPRQENIVGKDAPEEKVWEFRQNALRGKIFREMASGSHYTGNGVRLGEADKPIFWYRPANASMYRVIYGDLSVREVSKDALPATPRGN